MPVWLTSWGWHARAQLAPAIGLRGRGWPVIEMPLGTGTSVTRPTRHPVGGRAWWKLEAVLDATVDAGRPFVWVDDELRRDIKTTVRRSRPQPSLLMTPFGAVGLDAAHMDAIEKFVGRYRN